MRLRDTGIAAFLALQATLPLAWYWGSAADPRERYDERYAWRMFSPLRSATCDTRWTLPGGRTLRSSELHPAVHGLLRLGRPQAVRAMNTELCAAPTRSGPIHLTMRCHQVDGTVQTLWDGTEDVCR